MHGIETTNFFYGDAGGNMFDFAKGGDDAFTASLAELLSQIFSVAMPEERMSGNTRSGNDTFNKTGGEEHTLR